MTAEEDLGLADQILFTFYLNTMIVQPLVPRVLCVSIISVTWAPSTISNKNYREGCHKWSFTLLNYSMSSTWVYPAFPLFNDKYKNIFRLFTCWSLCVLPQKQECKRTEFECIKPAAHWWTCCVYVASWVEKIKFQVCGEFLTTFGHSWQMIQTSNTFDADIIKAYFESLLCYIKYGIRITAGNMFN